MYFDPLSAWLVALIADRIIIAGEKGNSGAAAEYHKKSIKQSNDIMNAQIRRIMGLATLSLHLRKGGFNTNIATAKR
jgi:hypothetical protein